MQAKKTKQTPRKGPHVGGGFSPLLSANLRSGDNSGARGPSVAKDNERSWAAPQMAREQKATNPRSLAQVQLLIGDLHAEGFLVLVFVIIDINQDFFFASTLAWGKPQADGVCLPSAHLQGYKDKGR